MYLKRVKVRNFKSFAGTTEIPFEPGFTGVAGPNGMGKSNISDAILFVLGPTSSKALRADRLTHLFFNGGSSKKAATECEVSLTFDNKDHLLPVEASDVEVTRYVKLAPSDPNGYYSYFYVNGRRSTQTEIDSLLSHARLSGDGYNLVQQGDVNKIVAMGPIPRRGLVERLAGISQYDDELQRAETKRADLETNLGRINTLLTEIRNHLAQLESQRLAAIQYRQIQEEKRKAEARLARAGHRLAQHEVTSCEAQLSKINDELTTLRADVSGIESERQKVDAAIEQLERDIVKRGGLEAAKFKAELDAKRMAFARLDENVRTAELALAELDTRLAALTDQSKADAKEVARLAGEEKRLAGQLDAIEKAALAHTSELKSATGEVEQSQGKLAGTRKQILLLQQQQEEKERRWQQVVRDQESAKASLDSAERTKAQAEDDQRTRELELKDIELRTRPAKGDKGGIETATPELQKRLFQLKAKEKSLTTESDRLGQEVTELNRRYLTLDARLKARTEGGGRPNALAAVDFLLSQRNLGRIAGIRGTVEELARFDPENQTALHIAAGGRFQALVVETDQVAEECIKLLRTEKRGRATFLPLNKMLAGRPHGKSLVAAQSDGAVGFAIDLVHFDEELRPAFWFVFGETVVMRDLAAARSQMGGVRLVTQTGDLIEATGAMTGGFVETGGRGADNAVELKRLADELRSKSAAEAAAREELSTIETELRSLTEELAKRSGQAEAQSTTRQVLEKEISGARERLKEATRRIVEAEKARVGAETELASATTAASKLSEELASTKSSLQKLQEQYLGHLPGSVSTRIRSLQEAVQAKSEERLTVAKELEGVRASLAASRQASEGHQADLVGAKKLRTERSGQLDSTRTGRDEAKNSLEALRTVENQQLEAVKSLSEKKHIQEEARLKLVDRRARSEETVRAKETMLHQEEIRLAEAQHHLQEVEATLHDLPAEELESKPVPVDELKRTISTLTSQLEGMGSVNLRALEEYDSEKARLDEFQGEVSRLGTEKQELTSLVGEIEKQKRERLTQVVLSVDTGFREIYSDLSGGGEGEIALENPADPLAGGLLIKARPVGKIIQRLEQLSGGEKSLASLAFIFALQRHDPSPLYVFDEVDMSLDGVNAENVGRMLRRNAERAQFVVISLRKVTLKFAHRLFGVTMHGDGCSRVVSLKLDEIVDVDERERVEARPVLAPGGRMTISESAAEELVQGPEAIQREAAQRVLDYLIFHRSLLGEADDPAKLLERYLGLVHRLKDGVHVVIPDPYQKATALLFELVMQEEFDPWEIDLARFTQAYLERVRAVGGVDFAVAGRLLYMAWSILYLQSEEILKHRETPVLPTDEGASPIDDTYVSELDTPEGLDVTTAVLGTADAPPLVPMVRHPETRPVSLLELVSAFGEAEVEARRSLRIQELRDRLREEQRAPPEVLVHGDIPERDLVDTWEVAMSHPKGEPFPLLSLWRPTQGRDRLVALFLASLFLAREKVIDLQQEHLGISPLVLVRTADRRVPVSEE